MSICSGSKMAMSGKVTSVFRSQECHLVFDQVKVGARIAVLRCVFMGTRLKKLARCY